MKKYIVLSILESALLLTILSYTFSDYVFRLIQGIVGCVLVWHIKILMRKYRERRRREDLDKLLRLKPIIYAISYLGILMLLVLLVINYFVAISQPLYTLSTMMTIVMIFPVRLLYYLATKDKEAV